MYNFINSGIVGKSSSSNFMLHRPKNASIWSCMWPTKRKDTNTSLKMPFATNNDHYAKTYLFLLSLAQLSDWTRIVGGKFMAITGSLSALATNASIHLFHPTLFHIEVLTPCFQIIILKNKTAVSPNRVKALQITLSCGLNPPDTIWEHNEQIWHHRIHVQSVLRCQPKGLIFIFK